MNSNKKIAIIGAGITGLTIAYYLTKEGIKTTVFEKSDHIGGVINSITEDGFCFETGPNTGTLSSIEAVELFENLANDFEIEIANDKSKKRLIWKKGKWHALPSGLVGGITTPLFTFGDKLRILGEPFRKSGTNPYESVADMVKRRLGKSFLEYAVDPFISGVYAGDPEYLVTKFALPKLYNLEQDFGSFIGGSIKKAKQLKEENNNNVTKQVFSAKGGLLNIVKALVKNIGEQNILTNQNVEIEKKDNVYLINGEEYTHVITTINSAELPKVMKFIEPNELDDITNLKYARVAEVAVGFKKWQGIDINAFGGLVPTVEKKNILGVLFMSSMFKNRAPENAALLTVFVGGTKRDDLMDMTKEQLFDIMKKDLTEMLGLSEFKPDLLKIWFHDNAIAQYGKDSEKRFEAIERIENKYKNFILAGSIRDGIGMSDRIKQGTNIAKQVIG